MLFSNKRLCLGTSQGVSKLLLVILVAGIACTSSCTKEKMNGPTVIAQPAFFKNANDAFQKVQGLITRFHADEQLERINRISYLSGKDRSYAFVDYKSNLGTRNIAIEQTLADDGGDGWTSYQCDGTCDCTFTATGVGGVLKFKCSCSGCDLITH